MTRAFKKMCLVIFCLVLGVFTNVTPALADSIANSVSEQPVSVAGGNVNGDAKVDLADVIMAVKLAAGQAPAGEIFKTADVNQDGKIGLDEAIFDLQVIAGIRDIAKARVVLGPLSGANVNVYNLSDLQKAIYQTQTDSNGYFSTNVNDIAGDTLFLVKVSGGQDIDADDDGVIDADPTPNLGTIHALIKGDDFAKGGFFVSAMTDMAWQYTQNLVGDTDSTGILQRLDELARTFFQTDLDGDTLVTRSDLTSFSPLDAAHKSALNFDYQILFAQNDDGHSIISCYHENLPDVQAILLDSAFGDRLTRFPSADSQSDKVKLEVAVFGEGQVTSSDTAITVDTASPDATSNVAAAFYDPAADATITLTATQTAETEILAWHGCDSVSEDQTQCVVNMRTNRLATLYFGYKETQLNENLQLVDLTEETVIISEDRITLDVTLTSGAISDLDNLIAGDVVVSSTGQGFLRRIVNVEKIAADHYLLTTENVALEQVISKGSGVLFKEMTHDDLMEQASALRSSQAVSGVETVPGVRLLPAKGPNDRVFRLAIGDLPEDGAVAKSTGGDLTWTDPHTGYKLTLSGTIDVTIDVETGVSFNWLTLQDFTFIPRVNAEESLEISVTGELKTPKLEKKLATFYFSPIVFFIGPVPVVVGPQVDLVIGIDAKLGAQVSTGISFTQVARAGIVYNRNAGLNVVKEFTISHDFTKPVLTAYVEALPYIKGSPSMMIYGVTGPGVFLRGYLKLRGEAETPVFSNELCSTGFFFSAYAGMHAGFAWELGLLENILGDWSENVELSFDLYKQEWLLRKWNVAGDCTQPPYLEVQGPDIIKTVMQGSGEMITQQYTLKNSGELPMDWKIDFIQDAAISILPLSGNLDQDETTIVTVSIDSSKLSKGIYRNTVNFKNLYDPGLLAGYASGSTSRQVQVQVMEQASGETFTNSLGMTFKRIPAGTFTMGSPTNELGRYGNETQHQVTLTQSYYIQTKEVTQGQWKAVMGNHPSYFINCGDNCPVEQVSWYDVQAFITELNKRGEGTYRLPTEAEWEYAARAGSTTAFANGGISVLECSYDPNLDAMGWYCGNSGSKTHPAAQKLPNAWGLYDMHGNVWEWCQDWYGIYPSGAVLDPTGPSSGANRVIRGGSWYHYARSCRSAFRGSFSPGDRRYLLGFRLARIP